MTRINVNLEDVEGGFETFPDDTYKVELQTSSKIKKSDAGAFIQWIAKCTEGEMESKLIGWNSSLLPQALWNLKALLKAIGVKWDEEGFELEECYEKELLIDVSTRKFTPEGSDEEETRNQVDKYHAV